MNYERKIPCLMNIGFNCPDYCPNNKLVSEAMDFFRLENEIVRNVINNSTAEELNFIGLSLKIAAKVKGVDKDCVNL